MIELFQDIANGRTSSGFGPNPLGNVDILAWSQLHGVSLSSFELKVIKELDRAYLMAIAPEPKQ